MKTSRLLVYGIVGIITGLLLENKFLVVKQDAREAKDKVKKKLGKLTHSKG